jgi:hypothetical protein
MVEVLLFFHLSKISFICILDRPNWRRLLFREVMILTNKLLSWQNCNSYLLRCLLFFLIFFLALERSASAYQLQLNSTEACTATASTHAAFSLAHCSTSTPVGLAAHGPISLARDPPILGPPRHLSSHAIWWLRFARISQLLASTSRISIKLRWH